MIQGRCWVHKSGMMMTLNRRIHRAYQRTRDANFSLEGLTGFTCMQRQRALSVPVKSGVAMLRILRKVLVCVCWRSIRIRSAAALELGVEYVRNLPTLFSGQTLSLTFIWKTPSVEREAAFDQMKKWRDDRQYTSRGTLIDSQAANWSAAENQKNWFVRYGRRV